MTKDKEQSGEGEVFSGFLTNKFRNRIFKAGETEATLGSYIALKWFKEADKAGYLRALEDVDRVIQEFCDDELSLTAFDLVQRLDELKEQQK